MAEGRTKIGMAPRLWLADRTIETHVTNTTEEDHRRVLAVPGFRSQHR
jgi:hypothetical protein